ncbi:MAG: hypothetical protein JO316_05990 [Abitibacteriaceae bacterium]|nr:hypothetical protein [Abditibacteriaceae bacterium]
METKNRVKTKQPKSPAKNGVASKNLKDNKVIEAKKAEQIKRNQAAITLLRSWRECSEEEAQEQRETGEYLMRVLDEDRLSNRKLFP